MVRAKQIGKLSCISGVRSNPADRRTNNLSVKNITLYWAEFSDVI